MLRRPKSISRSSAPPRPDPDPISGGEFPPPRAAGDPHQKAPTMPYKYEPHIAGLTGFVLTGVVMLITIALH